MRTEVLTCAACTAVVARRSPTQKYCKDCSARRDLQRKRLWAQEHPPVGERLEAKRDAHRRLQPLVREAGASAADDSRRNIAWCASIDPDLLWMVRIKVPFTYAASKNHIYTMRRAGHVALRREAKAKRTEIALRIRQAVLEHRIAHNKLWIDLLVQKPDHRGDAVNVVDLVCDAVKDAVELDDRWFCIRRLDWEIVKRDPQLVIGIGQTTDIDCQVCSHCGQVKPFDSFTKRKSSRLGIGRACRTCLREGRRLAKKHGESQNS